MFHAWPLAKSSLSGQLRAEVDAEAFAAWRDYVKTQRVTVAKMAAAATKGGVQDKTLLHTAQELDELHDALSNQWTALGGDKSE